jgi:hypothetical protein
VHAYPAQWRQTRAALLYCARAVQPLRSRRSCSRTESRLRSVRPNVHPTIVSRLCSLPSPPALTSQTPAQPTDARTREEESRGEGKGGRHRSKEEDDTERATCVSAGRRTHAACRCCRALVDGAAVPLHVAHNGPAAFKRTNDRTGKDTSWINYPSPGVRVALAVGPCSFLSPLSVVDRGLSGRQERQPEIDNEQRRSRGAQ